MTQSRSSTGALACRIANKQDVAVLNPVHVGGNPYQSSLEPVPCAELPVIYFVESSTRPLYFLNIHVV